MCYEKMLTVVHLCCGIGGTALGFKEAGITPIYANDCCELVARTFEKNLALSVDLKDVNQIDLQDLPEFDILTASLMYYPIKGLLDQVITHPVFKGIYRVIQHSKPKVFCLDTVYVKSLENESQCWYQKVVEAFEELGYTIKTEVLSDQETGGCPTPRKTQFILGFLENEQAEKFKGVQPTIEKLTLNDCIHLEVEQSEDYYFDKFNPSKYYQKIESIIPKERGIYKVNNNSTLKKEITSEMIENLDLNQGRIQIFSGFEKRPNIIIRDEKGVRIPTLEEWLQIKGFTNTFRLSYNHSPQVITITSQYKDITIQLGATMCPSLAKQVALAIKETF